MVHRLPPFPCGVVRVAAAAKCIGAYGVQGVLESDRTHQTERESCGEERKHRIAEARCKQPEPRALAGTCLRFGHQVSLERRFMIARTCVMRVKVASLRGRA